MEFYEVINNRKSIKKFRTEPLDKTKIEKIVHATMMAPSWKNNTSYKLILVDNAEEKKVLSEAVNNDENEAQKAIQEAPVAAVIVGNPSLSGNADNKDYYLVDSAIAMEHLVLAATAEGYGTCWVGAVDENKVREILSIPDNYKVVAMSPIGVIDERESHYPEKNKKDYIFHNKWDTPYKH